MEVREQRDYLCPGEQSPISRSVHLGRLARFYPACRQCPQRDDTGSLSTRQVERLVEAQLRGGSKPLFGDEGAGGVYLNDFGPDAAREMAAALGILLQTKSPRTACEGSASEHPIFSASRGEPPHAVRGLSVEHVAHDAADCENAYEPLATEPVVVIAGDGRPSAGELVAAVCEGLRWAGCHVVDIGPASSACLGFAIDHLQTAGGVFVGNPGCEVQTVGLKFFGGSGPLSGGGPLDQLREIYDAGPDRPTRTYGSLRRFQAEGPYLAVAAESYHALRPLRFVLDSACRPLAGYLQKLTKPVACEIFPRRTTRDRFSEQVVDDAAHFGVRVDGDGERCEVFDERGRRVSAGRMLVLLARHLRFAKPQAAVVVEDDTLPALVRAIGDPVVLSDARRSEMASAMRVHKAIIGGGPSGRFWHVDHGPPLPDALGTVTALLEILSRSDRPLSEVLDREAAAG